MVKKTKNKISLRAKQNLAAIGLFSLVLFSFFLFHWFPRKTSNPLSSENSYPMDLMEEKILTSEDQEKKFIREKMEQLEKKASIQAADLEMLKAELKKNTFENQEIIQHQTKELNKVFNAGLQNISQQILHIQKTQNQVNLKSKEESLSPIAPVAKNIIQVKSNIKKKNVRSWIPDLTSVEVVALNGVTVPVGSQMPEHPFNIRFYVTSSGWLRVHAPHVKRIKKAIISGVCWADSQRTGRIRIKGHKLVIEDDEGNWESYNIKATFVDESGKEGMAGVLHDPRPGEIWGAVGANLVEGVGRGMQALSNPMGSLNIGFGKGDANISYQDVMSNILKYSLGNATAQASQKVSDFILDLAKSSVPFVETEMGRKGTFIFLEGIDLDKDLHPDKSQQNLKTSLEEH